MSESQEPFRESMVDRFVRNASINLDNWRDPQHDLEAIRLATDEERVEIESFLIRRGVLHFMDAEALALLDSPRARQVLDDAFQTGTTEVRAAVAHLVPHLLETRTMIDELVRRVEDCDAYNGLSLTLTQIESTHPPEVISAMLRRIASDPGVTATHYAGLLLFLYDHAKEPFDWEHRPFLLRFNPGNEVDRRQAFAELCVKVGQAPANYDDDWPK